MFVEGFESGEFLFGRWLLSDDVEPFDALPLRAVSACVFRLPLDDTFALPLLLFALPPPPPPLEDDLVFGLDPTGLEVMLGSDMLFL